jgi:hypothetical protein
VCVAEEYRRKKVATSMLRQYVNDIALSPSSSSITTIALIAKQHLLSFYVSCGFSVVGLSEIVHGKDPWFHLTLSLTDYRKSKFYVVDAFTSTPGCGNPAAVVLAPPSASDDDMQTIAKEVCVSFLPLCLCESIGAFLPLCLCESIGAFLPLCLCESIGVLLTCNRPPPRPPTAPVQSL